MAIVLLLLSLGAAVAAIALWRAANKQELPAPAPAAQPEIEAEAQPEPEPKLSSEVEPAPLPEPLPEPMAETEAEPDSEPAPEPEPEPQPQAQPPTQAQPEHHARLMLPGALKRERRHWAEAKNFEFLKSDDYLADEWTRGAAASGAAPRDIVVGNVFGHEMLLMDLGGINVMAMRTGAASEEVIDFRRDNALTQESSNDLLEAFSAADFTALATDTDVAQRMRDIRVDVALERMPKEVTGIWMESEWVLAQTTKNAMSPVWEEMLAPLALLADAARTLPPRPSSGQKLRLEDGDPTRLAPPAGPVELSGLPTIRTSPEHFEHPPVQRPEEPIELPTRVVDDSRGDFDDNDTDAYDIGADDVDAIGEQPADNQTPNPTDVRITRQQGTDASIFEDYPE
ncbi:hypothetical protein [Corynebacterium stationis]|uniref:hypothetical protein n=1 Tax=Corynebacterium stationis TaxID=1705 RepID=UPI00076F5E38|nr:hypothetical protein [Corynebacterium stationis]AMJ45467.1 hypothetical protein AW169_11875 [Corynebacterium stationis]AQX71921.1 hypothetical protein CA21670_11085 [Corynebacterium stationis]ASJ19602.1 hypothetical protein BA700_11855 [Corynebacterium stationis]HJG63785.1 hypothetical protein [Corynebacterium stationis]